MLLSANAPAFAKVLTQLKTAQQYLVVVVNHGVKKELDALVKVLSAHHNGVVVV
jgi:large subunit ribosomal protein L4